MLVDGLSSFYMLPSDSGIIRGNVYNTICSLKSEGAWCNGNTWVSKTFVEGSNPSAPAMISAGFVYVTNPALIVLKRLSLNEETRHG